MTVSMSHNFWRERRSKVERNRSPSAYLVNKPNQLTRLRQLHYTAVLVHNSGGISTEFDKDRVSTFYFLVMSSVLAELGFESPASWWRVLCCLNQNRNLLHLDHEPCAGWTGIWILHLYVTSLVLAELEFDSCHSWSRGLCWLPLAELGFESSTLR